MPENQSKMSPYQQARAEALRVAASVLSASSNIFGSKSPVPIERGVDDLLKVSDWVLGDDRPIIAIPRGAFAITPDNAPSLFEMLGRTMPDCGHEDCPIHAPAREAKDLNPDDAKSSFDKPTEFTSGEDLSDAVTEELDRVVLGDDSVTPPVDLNAASVGQVFVHNNVRWTVAKGLGGTKYWERLVDSNQSDEADDEDGFDDLS